MNILIVRHGQTDWNIEHKLQGTNDIELNEKGIEQAKQTREKLLTEKIDIIISSPLKRARKTAGIINESINAELIIDDRIIERGFSEFEGLIKDNIDYKTFWNYKINKQYESAENIRDFFTRVYNFIDEIQNKYSDKNILLVTHGGVTIPVECYFNNIPEDGNVLEFMLKNCEFNKYSIKGGNIL